MTNQSFFFGAFDGGAMGSGCAVSPGGALEVVSSDMISPDTRIAQQINKRVKEHPAIYILLSADKGL
jgi:hypothetical protein